MKKICNYCGSEEVRKDAWVKWDEDKKEWVLDDIYDDNDYCINCKRSTIILDKEE